MFNNMNNDINKDKELFEGASVPRTIMKFAIPTVLSQLVTLIYNLADTFFVGHTNEPAQIAALALSFPLFMMLTMIGNLFGIGANSFISRSLGKGDRDGSKRAATLSFYCAAATVAVYMVIMVLFQRPILTSIGANTEAAYKATAEYLTWTVVWGGLPTIGNLMLGHLIRAEGNTKQASIGMAIGGILNIILDPIFIKIMGKGAAGAGLATAISNLVAFLYLLYIVRRTENTVISLNPKNFRFNGAMAKAILLVGLPSATIIILGATANMILNDLMSDYGDVALASYGIVQKFGSIVVQVTVGVSQGVMPLIGFSYGSGNLKRVRELNRYSFIILGIYSVGVLIFIELFAPYMLRAFTAEPETVALGTYFARLWIISAPGMSLSNIFGSIFQAVGRWKEGLAIPVFRQGLVLIPLNIILGKTMGQVGLIIAQPIADTSVLFFCAILYYFLYRKLKEEEAAIAAKKAADTVEQTA